ncbi:MAG: phosphoribosylanthranilate isomerase [Acidobacteriota bacterium]
MRPKVKICGVTTPADARRAVALGADYLGLNFYEKSPRFVGAERAQEIADAVAGSVDLVGVFVDTPLELMQRLRAALDLRWVQLHGNEPPEVAEALGDGVIKALRVAGPLVEPEIAPWSAAGALLFDTPPQETGEELYGGTGRSWSYGDVVPQLAGGQRIFIAGGIRPGNVAEVAASLPGVHAIDVCSGVESEPGIKSESLMIELFKRLESADSKRPEGARAQAR